MHIHILGICGTFMGGLAALAKSAGHKVTGCDSQVYPPMSEQLGALGIDLIEGWDESQLALSPDLFIVGNVVSRGNPLMEAILDRRLPYTSGPQWLSTHILQHRKVLAIAGTHGKTTTSSLVAHILEASGYQPGFLIGGVPGNFGISARLGEGDWFVIEADEYDTAFFDKRAKFVHYKPTVMVLNNLEFDHADIYKDLEAIEWQFHQLLRILPRSGVAIVNADDTNLPRVLAAGCWSSTSTFSTSASRTDATLLVDEAATPDRIQVVHDSKRIEVPWSQQGPHNRANTAAALLAATHVGIPVQQAADSLESFLGVARRMQEIASGAGVIAFDDFAHHPTAIGLTLAGMRDTYPDSRLLVALELRSNTMRAGVHAQTLGAALDTADRVFVLQPAGADWNVENAFAGLGERVSVHADTDAVFASVSASLRAGDRLVLMSNGAFGGLAQRVAAHLGKTDA